MKKILLIFLLLLVILAGIVFAARDKILQAAAEQAVTQLTGFRTEMASLHLDLPSAVRIRGLKIHNPPGFREPLLAEIPEIYASLDLPALLKRERLHLGEVRLHLQQIHIEKNTAGQTNVALLVPASQRDVTQSAAPAASERRGPAKPAMPFLLDRLELTIREVSYEDQSGLASLPMEAVGKIVPKRLEETTGVLGGMVPEKVAQQAAAAKKVVPKKVAVDMRLEKEVFTNIRDPKALVNIILVKIVKGTTFGRLAGIDPEAVMNDTLKSMAESGQELLVGTRDLIKTEVLSKGAGEAQTMVRDTFGTAKLAAADARALARKRLSGLMGRVKSGLEGPAGSSTAQDATAAPAASSTAPAAVDGR